MKRPSTTCPRCKTIMERQWSMREGVRKQYWNDSLPFLSIAGVEILYYFCLKCGYQSAQQAKRER